MTPAAAAMPPLLFGDTVSRSVGRAGAVNRYAFTITEPTAVVFDALTNNSQLRWQISGPTPPGAARAFTSSDLPNFLGNPVMTLPPASYISALSATRHNHG